MATKVSVGGVMPVILIIACIAGGYFFTYDQYVKFSAYKETMTQAQAQNDAVKQAQADLDGFLTTYRRSLESQPKVDRALPPGDAQVPYVLAFMEQMAKDAGLGVGSINGREVPMLAPLPHTMAYIDFDIQVTGTFAAFNNYLLLLEQHLRLSDVQSLGFMREEGENLRYSLLVRMYYQN